jgi:L-threonylcarbamoyladenylate synthase
MKVFNSRSIQEHEFELILSVLRAGGVIGFPTDTAYGLAADPFNDLAVARLFEIKGRPESKPVLVVVSSSSMAETVTSPHPLFHRVADAFWPGPLTMILPAAAHVSAGVTAGTGTIGVRWPIAPFATELVHRFGKPVTATSANRSGRPSCVTAAEVQEQLGNVLTILIDGGNLPARGGSTLLDLTSNPPTVLREGPVRFEALREFFDGNLQRTAQ